MYFSINYMHVITANSNDKDKRKLLVTGVLRCCTQSTFLHVGELSPWSFWLEIFWQCSSPYLPATSCFPCHLPCSHTHTPRLWRTKYAIWLPRWIFFFKSKGVSKRQTEEEVKEYRVYMSVWTNHENMMKELQLLLNHFFFFFFKYFSTIFAGGTWSLLRQRLT